MFRLLKGIIALGICLAVAAAGAVMYVQPDEHLDLSYSDISWGDKVKEMVMSRRLRVEMTEEDINQILKKTLSEKPDISDRLRITGAQSHLSGNELTVDINALFNGYWQVGGKLYFTLSWSDPYLTATHTRTEIKRATIPSEWLQLAPIQINVGEQVPRPFAVRSFDFTGSSMLVTLRFSRG
ncbi:hypothetical protein [Paenibacillus hamazuiensis]|uniref:hypothetical protein n=1 Tax=Paenibacillus hamazuiensis TaxID=2936508 RepID=UPI00200BFBE9|nr:hypothetical protein [Paenibacillus hamazuiensis]